MDGMCRLFLLYVTLSVCLSDYSSFSPLLHSILYSSLFTIMVADR